MHAEPPVTALFEVPFTKRQKSLLTIDVVRATVLVVRATVLKLSKKPDSKCHRNPIAERRPRTQTVHSGRHPHSLARQMAIRHLILRNGGHPFKVLFPNAGGRFLKGGSAP